MDKDLNSIIDKIKKCLALANSSNQNESEIALRQAQKLMSKYQVTEFDILTSDLLEKENKCKIVGASASMEWLGALVWHIGCFCGTTSYISYSQSKNKSRASNIAVTWFGTESGIEISSYYFEFLTKIINKKRKEFIDKFKEESIHLNVSKKKLTDSANGYVLGLAIGIIGTLKSLISKEDQEHKKQLHEVLAKQTEFSSKEESFKPKKNHNNYSGLGFEEGKKIQISKGLNGGSSQAMIE